MNSALLVAITTTEAVVALVVLGRTVARTERSRFRYATWRLRDEIYDGIASGEIADKKPFREFIDELEASIAASDTLSPFFLYGAARIVRRGELTSTSSPLDGLTHDEHVLLASAKKRAHLTRTRLMFAGSPSGWLLTVVAIVAYPFLRHRVELDGAEVEAECAVTPVDVDERPILETTAAWSRGRLGSSGVFGSLPQDFESAGRGRAVHAY